MTAKQMIRNFVETVSGKTRTVVDRMISSVRKQWLLDCSSCFKYT